jgi:hypothetical protein
VEIGRGRADQSRAGQRDFGLPDGLATQDSASPDWRLKVKFGIPIRLIIVNS